MNIPEEIERLAKLRADGVMTEDEFARAKSRLLDAYEAHGYDQVPPPRALSASISSSFNSIDENTWAVFIHLGQFFPGFGWVIPIVIWQIKKQDSAIIDEHGKNVVNWMLSALIYFVVSMFLVFVFVGVFLLIAVAILCVVFPIIGAIKANEGTAWEYPLAIKFFR
ncbi:MAG: putative Tic20 family protein [Verrucomicrobiales bacterium]|jgi:uncharacterized Tic20 family protein